MKVTFVLPCFSRRPTGGMRVIYELANGLAVRGHEVSALHPRLLPGQERRADWRSRASDLINEVVALVGVPWMTVHPKVRMLHVHDVTERTVPDADIIVAMNPQTAKAVDRLSARKGRRYYLVMDFYPYLATKDVLEPSWRSGYRLAAISQWLADLVLAAGVDARDVAAVSCGISSIHTMHTPPENRKPSIAMMYGLTNYKTIEDGVAALEIVQERLGGGIPVRTFGANTSRRPHALPSWATYEPLLRDREISDIYNEAAVFVSSSAAEGFCLPAGEAMASGCAVVATDNGGIRDFAVHGKNALLSPPRNPTVLAENIIRVLTDEGLRCRIAHTGAETMRAFTWAAAVERFERFIQGESACDRVHPHVAASAS